MATYKTKRTVRDVLCRLPYTCLLEDVQYHLYVIQAIERRQREIAEGRGIPHREVVRRIGKKWRGKSAQ